MSELDALSPLPSSEALPTVAHLENMVHASWPAIRQARELTAQRWAALEKALAGVCSTDASVVMFGSIARGEATPASDADWALLVDGQANPEHVESAQQIRAKIKDVIEKDPGQEGVFGTLTFSHDLIQFIGGEDDTNKNLTRRNLLLLESRPFGCSAAFERTLKQVLHRYISEDLNHPRDDRDYYVPRFLLNDIARFWRTMTVDFAYKRKGRTGKGLAIRITKLRMSRKLLFASGLVACFACELQLRPEMCKDLPRHPRLDRCQACLLHFFRSPPLENLATLFVHFIQAARNVGNRSEQIEATARKAFDAYDSFLAILNDDTKRKQLEHLDSAQFDNDAVFTEARSASRDFRDALQSLFFNTDTKLTSLTQRYGIF